jgi:hypothetical protein
MVVSDLGEPLTAGGQGMEDRQRQIASKANQVVSEQFVPKKARALMVLLKPTDLTNAQLFKAPLVIGVKKQDRNATCHMCLLFTLTAILFCDSANWLLQGVAIADTEGADSCRKFVCKLDSIAAQKPNTIKSYEGRP